MKSHIRPALVLFALLAILTGGVYPAIVTGIGQLAFHHAVNGSIIDANTGSELIGQPFDAPEYFWGRPSATGDWQYNALASSGSNQGPTNPALLNDIAERVKKMRDAHPDQTGPVPIDLVTSSRQRARSAHQPRSGRISGDARRQSPRQKRRRNPPACGRPHRGANARPAGGATRQRAEAEFGLGWKVKGEGAAHEISGLSNRFASCAALRLFCTKRR